MPPITFTSSASPAAKRTLIYFITGNPGLIDYYGTFLSTLNQLLRSRPDTAFTIYGQSLAGFDPSPSSNRPSPYSLQEVIATSFSALQSQSSATHASSIILIGHSVGSYIALELARLSAASPAPLPIAAAILLFPTVTHIAQSPSGLKLTKLLRIPEFPRRASVLAKWLLWPLPAGALDWLVGKITGMSEEGRRATLGFLRSERGVWQALHLARDEMEQIDEDRWEEDVWGAERGEKALKLVFYFGRNDHWVADHTRDALIEARGSVGNKDVTKPKMLLDEDGIPHSFCIHHSEQVAEKVHLWIEEILDAGL